MPAAETPERVLMICAHPDDVDFGSAGSLALWSKAGAAVTYCLVTSGDAGGSDRSSTRLERAALRESEQRAAAATVGVTDVRFLGYRDGRVEYSLELRRDLARVIRQVRPDRVLTQSPLVNLDRIYASHPDHLATGQAALAAVYPDSRNPFAFPELLEEGLEPWTVPEVYIGGGPKPDVAVDITDVIELKVAALLCHKSQIADPDAMSTMIHEWAASNAQSFGLAEGRLAEVFRRVATV